jgi:AcrR family transcriptional regulator
MTRPGMGYARETAGISMRMVTLASSKREQLLEAAWSLIAEHGVHKLRVEDVAEKVGVAYSLVYYHFDSRAGLLAATVDYNDLQAASTLLRTGTGTGLQRVEAALLADFGDSKRVRANNTVWNELNAAATFDEDLRVRVSRTNRQWVADIGSTIRDGQLDGSIRSDVDPDFEAELLTSLQSGLITGYLVETMRRAQARKILRHTIASRLQT